MRLPDVSEDGPLPKPADDISGRTILIWIFGIWGVVGLIISLVNYSFALQATSIGVGTSAYLMVGGASPRHRAARFHAGRCSSPLCAEGIDCVLSVRIAAALVSLNGHMKIRRQPNFVDSG